MHCELADMEQTLLWGAPTDQLHGATISPFTDQTD